MRFTKKKRGGYEAAEDGKFANYNTEMDRSRRVLRALRSAVTEEEKVAAFKQLMEFTLTSAFEVRTDRTRRAILQKINEARSIPMYAPLIPLMDEAVAYIESIPESDIVGGKRRKTKKSRKTRKNYRK